MYQDYYFEMHQFYVPVICPFGVYIIQLHEHLPACLYHYVYHFC